MHSDEWGAGAVRFDAFAPWMPLCFFGITATALAAGMTNPLFKRIRRFFGLPATTKWTILKWRLILLTIAFITLVAYNLIFFNDINYNFIERCLEDIAEVSQNPDFNAGEDIVLFIFYYLPIFCTPLFFLHGLRAALVSRKNRSTKKRAFLDGLSGIPQTVYLLCLFCCMFSGADYVGDGLFIMADLIPANVAFFIAGIPWAFFENDA